MRSVLKIAQSALYEIGVTPPSDLLDGSPNANQIKAIIENTCLDLRKDKVIPTIKSKYEFNTVASKDKYPLPEDFEAVIGDTHWDQTSQLKLLGPLSDQDYNRFKFGIKLSGNPFYFRIFGSDGNPETENGQLEIYPVPSDVYKFSFEYINRNMILPPYFVKSESITSGDYRHANGNIYKSGTTGTAATTIPSHASGTTVVDGISWEFISAPYEEILSNNDITPFNEDVVMLGIQFRWKRSKEKDFSTELAQYASLKTTSKTKYTGSVVGRSDMPSSSEDRRFQVTPNRSWSF